MTRAAKIKATKAAKKTRLSAQTIAVDKDWRIERVDDCNWRILYKDEFRGYFYRLVDALDALPHRMLSEQAKTSLGHIHGCLKAIQESIQTAVTCARIADLRV